MRETVVGGQDGCTRDQTVARLHHDPVLDQQQPDPAELFEDRQFCPALLDRDLPKRLVVDTGIFEQSQICALSLRAEQARLALTAIASSCVIQWTLRPFIHGALALIRLRD